jgi:hypothetical protein
LPIRNPKYSLTRAMVSGAPEDAGVFALWEGDELIYVGRASAGATIRQRLEEHLEQRFECTTRASHYSWELSLRPAERELEILRDFNRQLGRLPKCNALVA